MKSEVMKTTKTVVDCVNQQRDDMKQVTEDALNAAKTLRAYAESMPDPGAKILRSFKSLFQ